MFQQISKPSIVFFTGILVITGIFVFFIYLFISGLEKIENINFQINHLNHLIFENMAENSIDENKIKDLNLMVNQILKNPTLLILFSTIKGYELKYRNIEIRSREDLIETYYFIEDLNAGIYMYEQELEISLRIFYLLVTITIIILVLFLGVSQYENHKILSYEKLRNVTNNKLYDQLEKDRSLIAFELHDDIAQKLAIIKRYFNNKNSIDDHTLLMEKYSIDIIKRVRYLSRMLKAPDNPEVSFKDYLETLFSDFNVLSGFKLNRKTIGLNALKLEPTAALHIYRIIQEVLTNSRIHSEATEIDLLLVYSHPTLNITYKDNGIGFDPYLVYRKGIGLDSIKYRLAILKGDYKINSIEGEGTDISIDIPVELCEIS